MPENVLKDMSEEILIVILKNILDKNFKRYNKKNNNIIKKYIKTKYLKKY